MLFQRSLMSVNYFHPLLFATVWLALAVVGASAPGEMDIDQLALQEREASKLKEDFQRNLHPWVLKELETTEEVETFQATESFLLQLKSNQEHQFRWQTKTKKSDLRLKIRTFTQESGDDIVIIKNPEEENKVIVEYRFDLSDSFLQLQSVYLFKLLNLRLKEGQVFIKVKNTHAIPIILQVSLQGDPTYVSPQHLPKNDDFLIPASKLTALLDQMKQSDSNRKYLYKWQWGFLERGKHYQQQMVKLTAAELLIILVTAVIQMYCIKGLLDNHQVV